MSESVKKSPSMKLMKKSAVTEGTSVDQAEANLVAEAEETTAVAVAAKADVTEAQTITAESDDMIVKTAHEIENLKEDKAFKLVPQLLNNIDHDYFRLGGVLSVIQAQGWYMDKNYENFRAFVESECGIQYRKAMYLISIYNGLVESGVQWEQVKHLGWTKLKELSSILTPDNVDEWVGAAEAMTVLQLQEHIKAKSAGASTGGDAPATETDAKKTTTMTFKLHEDQKQTVREALDKAKHETGTEFDAVALEQMALDFLGGTSKLKAVPTLKELMAGKSAEEVLQVFGEVFPDVELTAELPE